MDVDDISQKSYVWNEVYKICSVYNMLIVSYILITWKIKTYNC